jgi:hypothetical protein
MAILKNSDLLHTLEIINSILEKYQQPVYYTNPRFHFSFGWDIGQKIPSDLTYKLTKEFPKIPHIPIMIQDIRCKIGNKDYTFDLQ